MSLPAPSAERARSARLEVRNPVLGMPAVRTAIEQLTDREAAAVRAILLAIQADARERADKSWSKKKPPLAAYWAAVGVYCGHISRALRRRK
ncbi:hypothetical protein ETR14_27265 (plasmid) [Sphingosinicella sp. BN140058]|nr:hypothetical protein ETR14_27265 [Sphingosinicella sp. BN140058]